MKAIEKIKKFFDLEKPVALGWGEWEDWHEKTKSDRPFAYFVMETIPDKWDDVYRAVTRPFNNARDWIRYRSSDRYHIINTGLRPGYHELDERMLHGMFSLLVDFVEVESAWMHVVFDKNQKKKYCPPWWSFRRFRFNSFRSVEAGLAHLKWEMTLDSERLPISDRNPGQAEMAREVWELYHWWKHIRPTRPDPDDISGWSSYCRSKTTRELFGDNRDPDEEKASMDMIMTSRDIERAYDDEDDRMLMRLIKIRKSLWT